jgi:hypothetical protein
VRGLGGDGAGSAIFNAISSVFMRRQHAPDGSLFPFARRAWYTSTTMNSRSTFAVLALLAPLAIGCAGRTAPFNEMDKAQITVLRLSQPPPPVTAPSALPGVPGLPGIPGIPPELQQMGQQVLAGVQQALPPGILPPGLIPGAQPAQPAAPVQPQVPLYKNAFAITAQMPLTDETLKNDLLDLLGKEDNFKGSRGNCFMPGMAISMQRPGQPPADVMISLSCNQAVGDGFKWPYAGNGFSPEAHDKMTQIYTKLWGPVPAGA